MFQRLTNLFFGEVEEVAAELNGPKPCVTEADEEGWMIVNLPGKSDPFKESSTLRRLFLGGSHEGEMGNQQGHCANAPILPNPQHRSLQNRSFPSASFRFVTILVMTKPVFGDDICVWFCSKLIPMKSKILISSQSRHYVTDIIICSESQLN